VKKDYLADYEDKREAFRRDTLEAWDHYLETGQHLTASEANDWLCQLEQGNDVEPPPFHGSCR
jgi:predicted transcriptional regulator